MEGQLSFKAIIVGFIVDVFATQTIGGLISGVASGMMMATAIRAPGGPAAMNALASNPAAFTKQLATFMSSPPIIVATIASGVIGSIIGGYITGLLAPGAELKNAAVMGLIGLVLGVLTVALAPGLAAMTPAWVTFVSCALTLPAVVCGAALRQMKNSSSPSHTGANIDRFNQ
jgi:hypothetical protein